MFTNAKKIPAPCIYCNTVYYVWVERADFERWASTGDFIQECFPYLDKHKRELLISNTCQVCFEEMFGEEDEEYYDEEQDQ